MGKLERPLDADGAETETEGDVVDGDVDVDDDGVEQNLVLGGFFFLAECEDDDPDVESNNGVAVVDDLLVADVGAATPFCTKGHVNGELDSDDPSLRNSSPVVLAVESLSSSSSLYLISAAHFPDSIAGWGPLQN